MTTYELPDKQFQKLDIENQLSCPVCTNTYYNPITLLCQHTFCYHCISDEKIKDCPVCRTKKFIPSDAETTITPNIFNNITDLYYGIQEIDKIGNEVNEYLTNKRLKPEIEKEMENTILETLNGHAVTAPVQPSPNIGIITSTYAFQTDIHGYNTPQPSYNKYFTYLKWIMLGILSLLCGYLFGGIILSIIDLFKGKTSLSSLLPDCIRLFGIMNIIYQFLWYYI